MRLEQLNQVHSYFNESPRTTWPKKKKKKIALARSLASQDFESIFRSPSIEREYTKEVGGIVGSSAFTQLSAELFAQVPPTSTMTANPSVIDPAGPSVVIPVNDSSDPGKPLGAGSPGKVSVPKLAITWENVSFQVKIEDPATSEIETKTILNNVSGEAVPGELLVLMGPSGAGKSSLLDCISGRNRSCTGTILVNGKKWSKGVAKHTSYVMQDDLFYANLTVLEHLTFQAELRMGKSTPSATRAMRVRAIISEMGLTKVTNTPIGDMHVKGLSGGQRKRLSFATELLTNPSLLFVDEPTSGLDSFMAETVTVTMRNLARSGRTVIATIHQPSSELFELFDRLYLLVDGCTVYNGRAADSLSHFASLGLQCPSFMNPTDYFMKQLAIVDDQPESRDRVKMLVNAWKDRKEPLEDGEGGPNGHRSRAKSLAEMDFDHDAALDDAVGLLTQLNVLCRRNWLRLVRDVIGFRARIGSTIFITVVIGLIFLQLDLNQKGVQDFTGAMFFMAVNQLFSSANPEFITVPLEIPLVMREHNGGLYSAITWYLAKNVSELPAQLLFPAIFLLPCYFMVGFGNDATVFFSFFLIITLLSSSATGLGYMVSCLAKRVDLAPIMGILFILPSLLFGGLFLNSESTPVYFIWLQPLSPIKYGFHALMRAFWSRVDAIDCSTSERCVARSGADVLEINSVHPHEMWLDCVVLVALNAAFRLTGAFVLFMRSRKPQATAAP